MKNLFNHWYYLVFVLGAFIVAGDFLSHQEETTVQLNTHTKTFFKRVLPQGWAFFTKDPQEEKLTIYKLENDNYELLIKGNPDKSNLFGLSRKGRRVAYEFSLLLSQFKKESWTPRKGADIPQPGELSKEFLFNEDARVVNVSPGTYLAILEKPIPWAWKKSFQPENSRRKYVLFSLENCNRQLTYNSK